MTKVRMSQIPEESGKPNFLSKKAKASIKHSEEENSGEEQKRLRKTVINFLDEGIVISAYDLHTIEKDMRFVEKPKAHWEFGISVNKGLEPSQFVRKVDISIWYLTEEVRDEKWDKLMTILESEGLSVINI